MKVKDIYNDEEKVNQYVTDLHTLHEVIHIRREANRTFELPLKPIKIFGRNLFLGERGHVFLEKEATCNTFKIPSENDICPYCEQGWNIRNIEDSFHYYDTKQEKDIFYHKQCKQFHNLEIQRKEIVQIIVSAYPLANCNFKPIPNEYCSCLQCKPWFLITTPDGNIKIGWRKHVIHVEWQENYKPFKEKFIQENVTKDLKEQYGKRYIHAWSIDKCIEYLKKAKQSIL